MYFYTKMMFWWERPSDVPAGDERAVKHQYFPSPHIPSSYLSDHFGINKKYHKIGEKI